MSPPGRPRAYDPDAALAAAMGAFWRRGFAATSLDDLTAATGMNRPSLYAAFGDKEALYLKALARYGDASRAALARVLAADVPLRECLRRVFAGALDIYLAGSRGCLVVGTAATEAVANPTVRKVLAGSVRELDEAFAARMRRARDEGELDGDPAALAQLATATLHTLAIRARAGESRETLEKVAAGVVEALATRSAGHSSDRRGSRAPRAARPRRTRPG